MRKIMFFAFIATLFLGSFTLTSCGGSNGDGADGSAKVSKKDSPADAAAKMLDLFKEKKFYEGIMLCKDADKESEEDVRGLASLTEMAYNSVGGLDSYEFLNETISDDGTTAVIDVNFVYGNKLSKKDKINLEKTEKGWQVVLK